MSKPYNITALKVLLAEKHLYMRRIMQDILHVLGVKMIETTDSYATAYELYKENEFDLVITDWAPGLNGLELVRWIRTKVDTPNPYVPIIVITANTEIHQVTAARDAGMTEFLAKPFSTRFLYSRIQSIIEKKRLFIRTKSFFGPDRRRREAGCAVLEKRRRPNIADLDLTGSATSRASVRL